jgi:hypothetical protein
LGLWRIYQSPHPNNDLIETKTPERNPMKLQTEPYLKQVECWPQQGHQILAHYNDDAIVVYQAYRPEIGRFAAENNYFGRGFSYDRMSWIKPNFLWMMYRSGWGTKPGQEVTLAVWLKREFFETVLKEAVPSSFDKRLFASLEEWQKALAESTVRLQWDPDHNPVGQKLERRAIQLGLRHRMLEQYGREAILEIEDISDFVAEQRLKTRPKDYRELMIPLEQVYLPESVELQKKLGLASASLEAS